MDANGFEWVTIFFQRREMTIMRHEDALVVF